MITNLNLRQILFTLLFLVLVQALHLVIHFVVLGPAGEHLTPGQVTHRQLLSVPLPSGAQILWGGQFYSLGWADLFFEEARFIFWGCPIYSLGRTDLLSADVRSSLWGGPICLYGRHDLVGRPDLRSIQNDGT